MSNNKKVLVLFLFIILFLSYTLIPIYEKEDENFRILLFQNNKYWHDGISPLIFAYFKNYLENKSFSLPSEIIINEKHKTKVKEYVDVFCLNDICYPKFYNFGLLLFFEFSFWLHKIIRFEPLRFLIITNILIYSISIVILFLILEKIYRKKTELLLLISIITGLGTSFVIYSRYLILHNSFQILFFMFVLYFLVQFEKRKSTTNLLLFSLSIISFASFFQALPSIVILSFFLIFTFFYYKSHSKKIFSFILLFLLTISLNLNLFFKYLSLLSQTGKEFIPTNSIFYTIFFSKTFAIDMKITSLLYSVLSPGNAIFLKTYSIFGYFFGPKGIFVNSLFLLFSIFGILKFRPIGLRNKLLILLAFFSFLVAYINPDFEGGFTPRYVRHSELIIVILSLFLPSCFLKYKKINKFTILLFSILSLISILNSVSLSVRTDWNYEKITELVSYDSVLWPWVYFKEKNIILDLTKVSEQTNWKLLWEEGCNPPITEPRFSEIGIETGPCGCAFKNNASRNITIPSYFNALKITACSKFGGGDGTLGYVYLDGKEITKFKINPLNCEEIFVNISEFADNNIHQLTIESRRNKECYEEVMVWKKIELINLDKDPPTYKFNILDEIEKWKSMNEACPPNFKLDYVLTDYCYCREASSISYYLNVNRKDLKLEISACASYAGGDGVIAEILINGKLFKEIFIESEKCENIVENLEVSPGTYILTLRPKIYGVCNAEIIKWKKVEVS